MILAVLSSFGCYAGVHISYDRAKEIDRHAFLESMKSSGFDCVILDFKNVWGRIFVPTNHKLVRILNSFSYDQTPLAKFFRDNGIYVIGRVVVYKDPLLKSYLGRGYDVWVFPDDTVVENYNMAVIESILPFVDEVQLDYVRWPDASVGVEIPERRERLYRSLKRIVSIVPDSIPVSADIFGRIPLRPKGWWDIIGQDIYRFYEIFDILSPMAYPSHYWAKLLDPYQSPYHTILNMLHFGADPNTIRIWLQAFTYRVPKSLGICNYITRQIQAMYDLSLERMMFWMPVYDSLFEAFRNFQTYEMDTYEVHTTADSLVDTTGWVSLEFKEYKWVKDVMLNRNGWILRYWFSPLKGKYEFSNLDIRMNMIIGENVAFLWTSEGWNWLDERTHSVILVKLDTLDVSVFKRNYTAFWKGKSPSKVVVQRDGDLYRFVVLDQRDSILSVSPVFKLE